MVRFEMLLFDTFSFPLLTSDCKSRDEISFRGKDCITSGVLNPKTCHVIICIEHHFGVRKNFDMHSLKQVYFHVICVDLYGMNQLQNICVDLDFRKP